MADEKAKIVTDATGPSCENSFCDLSNILFYLHTR